LGGGVEVVESTMEKVLSGQTRMRTVPGKGTSVCIAVPAKRYRLSKHEESLCGSWSNSRSFKP
jgi:hypothetical protein